MQINAMFQNHRPARLQLSFEDFLYSGIMRRHSMVAMCEPEDLIMDHLPPFEWGDDSEISGAFAEACEQAVEYEVEKVTLDDTDVEFIREHFSAQPGRVLFFPDLLPPAA